MAGNSPPRRSSRARTAQSQSQHSSTPSSLSGRPERATRSLNKTASPQKSTPSLSDEPPDESVASTDDLPTKRRRTRAQGQEEDRGRPTPHHDTIEMAGDPDELVEEDDGAVRCVCGYDDYPGPPPADEDKKQGIKDSIDVEPLLPSDINDDVAGLFVQCDVCNVWQHGACVGIMSEESTPDEYFCEDCRKDLHRIYIATNGQRYSRYLPLLPNRRQSSTRSRSPRSRENRDSRETRSGRQSSITQASKRRSTMNSRDAAYDEEEQLRLAIEASKEDAGQETAVEGGSRRSKRGRDDSEEKQDNVKRPRTKSRTPSPIEDDNERVDAGEDSDETQNNRAGSKKPRHAVTRTQSQHKEKEREERERQRAEAAKKRSGRAERRRADGSTPASTILVKGLEAQVDTDSDPSEELPLAARVAANRTAGDKTATTAASETKTETALAVEAPPSSQPTPDTPPTSTPVQASSKPKRPQAKRGKGKNQYSKDREAREDTSPARSQSRDVQGHETTNPHHHGKPAEAPSKPHSRSKGGFNSKVSMTDLKRKAHAMLDYISRTQVEMAGETTPPNDDSPKPGDSAVPQVTENGTSLAERKPTDLTRNGESSTASVSADVTKDFKDMSSMEMMARLSTDLIKWQKEFAF
ncbi:Putative histone deacetylase complex subunit cti6 [Cytospora mali]|uniref:Histone deacetylase complex subunit cti6 n=1 Tax=Cytospora mali TaxID=578113 RepID=A0A194UR52_CYTMA|nr:Putative histone deacetylase complex subunit cti6 [Valsa mali var. pyri (nom. inval.)]